MSFPEAVVESPFGRVTVWATSANHVGVRTSGNINTPKPADGPAAAIVVNKVPMTLRADVTREAEIENAWNREDVGDGWVIGRSGGLMLSKVKANEDGTFDSLWPQDVSNAAFNKVLNKLVKEWLIDFIASPAGQALIAKAAEDKAASDLAAAESRLVKALAEVEIAKEAVVAARAKQAVGA